MDFNENIAADLSWMTREDIIATISNTFESEIVSDDPDWTIIKSKWKLINGAGYPNSSEDFLRNKLFQIYFFIYKVRFDGDNFMIIRGNNDDLEKYLKEVVKKVDAKYRLTDNSAIYEKKNLSRVFWASQIINKGEERAEIENNIFLMQNMLWDIDVSLRENRNLAYLSDLLIGTHLATFKNEQNIVN